MRIVLDGKAVEVGSGNTVADALRKAGINQETVLVKRRGELCADTETLSENDVLETIRVISGG
ncbi:MAG: MoaD/ThiS family protein [Candidatus Aenigmarchaeota archaeon]|nr:MoaD/ThiS family protein [Candidatus Aenigmarchaeota archaeon]